MSGKDRKAKKSLLSFGDEGEDAEEVFVVKKSRESKQIKKLMKQAPNATHIPEVDMKAFSSTTSMYSLEAMEALKQNQRYAVKTAAAQIDTDVMELCGDEAESLETLMNTEANVSIPSTLPKPPLPLADDVIPLPGRTIPGKVTSLFSENIDEYAKTEYTPLDEEQGEWEGQLARRAGVTFAPSVRSAVASVVPGSAPAVSTLHELQGAVRRRLQMLADESHRKEFELDHLEASAHRATEEEKKLSHEAHTQSSRLDFLQNMRLFVSDVVGMLRYKQPLISALGDTITNDLASHKTARLTYYTRAQEAELRRIKESGDLISLGGYVPSQDISKATPHTSPFNYDTEESYSTYNAAANVLLEDVRPDICSIDEILNKFSTYRDTYLEKYVSSFVSLSLLELLRPLVLVDIMPVDILSRTTVFELSSRTWYQSLSTFCAAEVSSQTAEYQHECDSYLLHKIVRDVVCPWIKTVIENGFDASSEVHALAVSNLIHQLSQHCKNDLGDICEVLMTSFQQTISAVCLPMIKSPPLYHGSGVFMLTQISHVVKCLNNLALLQGYLDEATVARYAWAVFTRQLQGPLTKLLAIDGTEEAVVRACRAVLRLMPQLNLADVHGVELAKNKYHTYSIPFRSVLSLLHALTMKANASIEDDTEIAERINRSSLADCISKLLPLL